MGFSEFAAGLWALVTGGGALLLALFYAFVLLRRRRAGEKSRIQPSEQWRWAITSLLTFVEAECCPAKHPRR